MLVVGEQGSIIHSEDGGQTWELQPTITSASLFSIAYRGGTNVWVAGRGGAILRRVDPIATVSIPVTKLPPILRGGSAKLDDAVDIEDIPKAVPPKKPEQTVCTGAGSSEQETVLLQYETDNCS